MAWDYDYEAGPPGGALTDLDTYCYEIRIKNEAAPGFRGRNPKVAYTHGEFSSPRKFHPASNVLLETWLRYTDAAGAVTHTDGRPGHVYENFDFVKKLLTGDQDSLIRLQRTAPEHGTVHMDVELLAAGRPTQADHIIGWPLHAPHPFWIGAAASQQSPTTVTNNGSAPVGDAIIDIIGGTDGGISHDDTGDSVTIAGALPSGGVRVDVGARTAVRISGGADWSDNLVVNAPWWIEFDPGANAVTAVGGSTVTVDFALQYR